MGVVVKQSVRSSIFLYAGVLIGGLNVSILFPKLLGEMNWGLLSIVTTLSVFVSQLGCFGTPSIVLKFLPYFRDANRLRNFMTFVFGVAGIGFLISAILFVAFKTSCFEWFNSAYMSTNPWLYAVSVLVLGLSMMLVNVLSTISTAFFENAFPSFVRELLIRLLQLGAVGLYGGGYVDFASFIGLYVGASFIAVLVMFVYLKYKGFFEGFGALVVSDIIPSKKMLNYGFFTLLAGFSNALVVNVDVLMIGWLLSDLDGVPKAGLYKTAMFIGTVVAIPYRPVQGMVGPIVAEDWKDGAMDKVGVFYKKTGLVGLLSGGLALILIVLNFDNVLPLFQKNMTGAFWVIVFIGLGNVIHLATGVNGNIIVMSKYYRWVTYFIVILAVLALGFNFWFIPMWDITGAAIATALSLVLVNVFRLSFVYVKYGWLPFDGKTVVALLILGGAFGIGYVIPQMGVNWIDLPLRSALVSLLIGGATFATGILPEMNEWLLKMARKLGLIKS